MAGFLQEFFTAVSAGIEGSSKEVRGKRQRTSPGGASGARQADQKEHLTPTQITEVSELF